jgi:pimeloyl-ACP methyl ester carboxylesterase
MSHEGKKIRSGGLTLNVLDEGEGPAVLLLHGFPDSSHMWRHQIPPLRAAGYRVIVPDQRGFGLSDKPQDPREYRYDLAVADAIGVLDGLGVKQAALIAHDWGAAVSWFLIDRHPQRFSCFSALSVGPVQSYTAAANVRQREMSWYTLFFQYAGVAERSLTANDWRLFREWCRDHAELDHWRSDLSREGALTAALNWYRGNTGNLTSAPPQISRVPTLGLWSEGDAYLIEEQMIAAGRYVQADWRYERVTNASHWMMLDRPAHITRLLLNFLAAHHPPHLAL